MLTQGPGNSNCTERSEGLKANVAPRSRRDPCVFDGEGGGAAINRLGKCTMQVAVFQHNAKQKRRRNKPVDEDDSF